MLKSTALSGQLRLVRDDLTYLKEQLPSGSASDAEVLRASAVLRRLLIDGNLNRAWVTVMGKTPFVIPNSPRIKILDNGRLREVELVAASSVRTSPSMQVAQVVVLNKIENGEGMPYEIKVGAVKLSKFLNDDCCILTGETIKRRELIQYVANKLGGVHYDESRGTKERKFQAIDQFLIGDRPEVIHEILACGQALANSDSTQVLLSRLALPAS